MWNVSFLKIYMHQQAILNNIDIVCGSFDILYDI